MGRPRQAAGSRRYFVTASLAEADTYAASVDRRPTTVAGELLLAGLGGRHRGGRGRRVCCRRQPGGLPASWRSRRATLQAAISTRDEKPSFSRMWETWVATVAGLR